VKVVWIAAQPSAMLSTPTMVRSRASTPLALFASASVRPTATRLAILALSKVVSAAARESSSESAERAVDAASIGPIVTQTQVRKTTVATSHPIRIETDHGAPAAHPT